MKPVADDTFFTEISCCLYQLFDSIVKKVINSLATKDDIKKPLRKEERNGEYPEEHEDMDEAEEEKESGH
uniref:Uncharacterized protein n=1 Tax=Romanomermis culicivorax TaxID=13658 RepID=A0A915J6V1_ROMCU